MAEGKSLPGTKCWIRRTAPVARISKGFSKICRSTSDWLSIIHAPCNATFYCRVAFMWRRITSASTRTFSAGRRWYEKKFFLSKIEKKKKSICCLSILSNFVASDLYYSIFFFCSQRCNSDGKKCLHWQKKRLPWWSPMQSRSAPRRISIFSVLLGRVTKPTLSSSELGSRLFSIRFVLISFNFSIIHGGRRPPRRLDSLMHPAWGAYKKKKERMGGWRPIEKQYHLLDSSTGRKGNGSRDKNCLVEKKTETKKLKPMTMWKWRRDKIRRHTKL